MRRISLYKTNPGTLYNLVWLRDNGFSTNFLVNKEQIWLPNSQILYDKRTGLKSGDTVNVDIPDFLVKEHSLPYKHVVPQNRIGKEYE